MLPSITANLNPKTKEEQTQNVFALFYSQKLEEQFVFVRLECLIQQDATNVGAYHLTDANR